MRLPALALLALFPGAAEAARLAVRLDGPRLYLVGEGGAVPLEASLVAATAERGRGVKSVRVPLVWRLPSGCGPACPEAIGEATAGDGALRAAVRIERPPGAAGLVLKVEVSFARALLVRELALEIPLGTLPRGLVGRDLTIGPARRAWLERHSPKWISLGPPAGALLIDDTVDDAALAPRKGGHTLRIDLDSAEARPFLRRSRCVRDWHAPSGKVKERLRLYERDDRLTTRLQLAGEARAPLIKSPWPDGRRAAFVLTDHADQTSAGTLAALAEALKRHQVPITKALFARGYARPQLEDPRVQALAAEMAARGDEIIPHSATPRPDPRAVTAEALRVFDRFGARTWIDHQPETNCEAFGDEGWRPGSRFGISDLLDKHGYRYVWATTDVGPGDLNLNLARTPDKRAPVLWPLGRFAPAAPEGLWMWRSMWAYVPARQFFRLYAEDRLDRLEAEWGLHVAHTYLESYHPGRMRLATRNLLRPADRRPGAPLRWDARFETLLASLRARADRGTLWLATLGALADRLRAVAQVTLTLDEDGGATVVTPQPLAGATFVLHRDDVEVLAAGAPPRGQRREKGATHFWLDLPAGETRLTFPPRDTPGHER